MTFYESPKITVDTSSYMHSLLFLYLDWNLSWMRQTAEVYDIQIDSNLKWLWPFRLINSFPAYHLFLLKHSLSKLSSLIKAWTCSIFPTFSGITESPLKSLSISRILTLLLFAISTKVLLEISLDLGQMYPAELEIKDTTESTTSASYLDLLLSIGRDGQLHTSIYGKRDDFNFHITNFPFLSSNIPSAPAYRVFISQLIRYTRACSSYESQDEPPPLSEHL